MKFKFSSVCMGIWYYCSREAETILKMLTCSKMLLQANWCGGSVLHSCSGGTWFESWLG